MSSGARKTFTPAVDFFTNIQKTTEQTISTGCLRESLFHQFSCSFRLDKMFTKKLFTSLSLFCMILMIFYNKILNSPQIPVKCGRLPQEEHIIIDNIIWQAFTTPIETYNLLNAYYDERGNGVNNNSIVRITLMAKNQNIANDDIFCQFWLNEDPDSVPYVSKASQFIKIWPGRKKTCWWNSIVALKFEAYTHFTWCGIYNHIYGFRFRVPRRAKSSFHHHMPHRIHQSNAYSCFLDC